MDLGTVAASEGTLTMPFRPILSVIFATIAACLITLGLGILAPAEAASNQNMNQPAVLMAPDPNVEIGIYAKPSRKEQKIGYGVGGDRVMVLEQVGSNEGYTWNYIRFNNPPYAEGWVRTDYLSFQLLLIPPIDTPQMEPSLRPDGYLGNQSIHPDEPANQQFFFQQQQNSKKALAGFQETVMHWFKKS